MGREVQGHLGGGGTGIGFQVFLSAERMLLLSSLYCIQILGYDFFFFNEAGTDFQR